MIALCKAIARDPWPLLDCAYYLLGLFALTRGGNLVCRAILTWSGITLPPLEVDATANLPALAAASGTAPPPSGTALAVAPPAAATPTAANPPPAPATSGRAGRVIGSLERLIILLGLVAGSWEILAAVIALKTVGRFKELDQRLHAEYFLIGSLASIVWAALISLILLRFDSTWGFHIADLLRRPND